MLCYVNPSLRAKLNSRNEKTIDEEAALVNILHLVTYAGETCPAYQQFSLFGDIRHKNTLCTYYMRGNNVNDSGIDFFSGDGTLIGFLRVLKNALSTNSYDVIHVHYSFLFFFLLLASLWLRRNLIRSTVYTVHTSYPNLKLRNRFFTAVAFAFSRRVVFCSKASRDSFPRHFLRLAGKRQRVIPNGVNLSRIDISPSRKVMRDSQLAIVSVGRLIKVKNPRATLEAFIQLAGHKDTLTFIGEGERREELQTLAEKNEVRDRIQFTGVIARDDVYAYLKAADLFVSSSRVEGMPIAVLEAMACRCPVILSDIPPHREISETADFIPLVSPDDPARLSREIERFRLMAPLERKRIGDMCRSLVEERFSLSKMLNEYHQIYREIISMNSSRDRAKLH